MSSITQYIIQNGIPENIFILLLALPILFTFIIFVKRVVGSSIVGIYDSLLIPVLLVLIGLKDGIVLFAVLLILMAILRYFLKKIILLSIVDTRILSAVMFCVLTVLLIPAFLYVPFVKSISLNALVILTMIMLVSYGEYLIIIWERRGFKHFASLTLQFLSLVFVSYLLLNWLFIKNLILKYPLGIILVSLILIILLAKWRGLKIMEYIRFKEVIKHVELSEKK